MQIEVSTDNSGPSSTVTRALNTCEFAGLLAHAVALNHPGAAEGSPSATTAGAEPMDVDEPAGPWAVPTERSRPGDCLVKWLLVNGDAREWLYTERIPAGRAASCSARWRRLNGLMLDAGLGTVVLTRENPLGA